MAHWISYSIVSCAAVSASISPADVFKIPSGIPVQYLTHTTTLEDSHPGDIWSWSARCNTEQLQIPPVNARHYLHW